MDCLYFVYITIPGILLLLLLLLPLFYKDIIFILKNAK